MKFRTAFSAIGLVVLTSAIWSQGASRVSIGQGGRQVVGRADQMSISGDGRFVAFSADELSRLVFGDINQRDDVYVRDRLLARTILVSADPVGRAGNGDSDAPSISADGRFVAFASSASNLVPNDPAGRDIFVRDLLANVTERVSVSSIGQAAGGAGDPDISGDGRFVIFRSASSNLVANDTNGMPDIFLHDRITHQTTRVSVSSAGGQASRGADLACISDDGRYVAFESASPNLVSGDTNNLQDIFLRDLQNETTVRVDVDSNGVQGNSVATSPAISADGRYVVFGSRATNLDPAGDSNSEYDVFVRDNLTGTTRLVDRSSTGEQANDYSLRATISADGRFVAFDSYADNLAAGDRNAELDIFVTDLVNGSTRRVSVGFGGGDPDGFSKQPVISADGRHIAFYSEAANLIPNDTNGAWDVFVVDRTRVAHGERP